MDHRVSTIISVLENNGWHFAGPADVQSDWWFQDMFLFTSTCSPVGVTMYLTLLICPDEKKYKEVWGGGFSREIPNSRNFTYSKQVTLNDMGRMDVVAFVKELNKLILTGYA